MSSYRAEYEPLIGEIIESVEILNDNEKVRFTLFGGETLTYDTYGDCCSHTWIEHITIPDNIKGAVVLSVSEPDLPPISRVDSESYEYISVYHTAFQTDRGEIILEYRNSSNGYYGGNLTGPYSTEI